MNRALRAARGVVRVATITAVLVGMLVGAVKRVEAEPVITADEAEEIRFMLRSTNALAKATDVVLDEALLKPYSSDLTWLQAFGIIVSADKVVERLEKEEYGAAALEASWAVANLEYGAQLRASTFPFSFSYLASAPIRLSLTMFAKQAFDAALNRQLAFYVKARTTYGRSHEFIMAGISDDIVQFAQSGWIYLVGDSSAPSYGGRIPSPKYTPEQVFGLGKAVYDASRQQADVGKQQELLIDEFVQVVNGVPSPKPLVTIGHLQDQSVIGGCGCYFSPVAPNGGMVTDRYLFSEDTEGNAWINIEGRDVHLRAESAIQATSGSESDAPFSAMPLSYSGEGVRVKVSRKFVRNCSAEPSACEVADYDVTLEAEKAGAMTVVHAKGECGC